MKINRNDPCPCGSGKKFKKCCLASIDIINNLTIDDNAINDPEWQKWFEHDIEIGQQNLKDAETKV